MQEKNKKEFHIEATSCEEADTKIAEVIEKIWNKSLSKFAEASDEKQKLEIAQEAIRRGCIPFYIKDHSEIGIYNALSNGKTVKNVAHHNTVFSSSNSNILQKE